MLVQTGVSGSRSVLQTCLVLLCILNVTSLSSPQCLKAVVADRFMKPGVCRASCGSLGQPADGGTFLGRLSNKCIAKMQQYRRPGVGPGSKCGFSNHQSAECPSQRPIQRSKPTEVNIIEAKNAHPFAICTIPKSGCTHLRKLLQAMMRYPEPLPYSTMTQQHAAHFWGYTTIWNYEERYLPADVYPSFSIGRNPYARLLSGFLDKMALSSKFKDDRHTGKAVNEYLKQKGNWEATVEHFHSFVQSLHRRGVDHIDLHFRPQHRACSANRGKNIFNFEYYLRIEEQAQWFPCFEQGLNLTSYTASGWQRLKDGFEVWVGANEEFEGRMYTDTQCWYSAPGFERCDQYYSATHPDWDQSSWATLYGPGARAVPLRDELFLGEGTKTTQHDTGASGLMSTWYTQEIADLVYELYKEDFELFGYDRMTFE